MAIKKTGTVIKDDIAIAIASVEKLMGNKGVPLLKRGSEVRKTKYDCISFGFTEINEAIHMEGLPRGKMVEIFGPESSGKSYITLKLMAEAHKKGFNCALVDAEQSFSSEWAEAQGVDLNRLVIMDEAISAEANLEYVNNLCKTGAFALVVVDSTAALIPQKEMDGTMEDVDVALLPRVMSKACKKIVQSCAKTNTTCIFVNQIRDTIGGRGFGDTSTTPGGKALKFYSSIRMHVVGGGKVKAIGENGQPEVIARKSYVTFVKNKVSKPYGTCDFEIIFDKMAMNPVVKMLKTAKAYKLLKLYKKQYFVIKEVLDSDKNLETGCFSFPELAHYFVNNPEYMQSILDYLKDELENETDDEKLKSFDVKMINEMVTNKDMWVSPLGHNCELVREIKDVKSAEEIIKEEADDESYEEYDGDDLDED